MKAVERHEWFVPGTEGSGIMTRYQQPNMKEFRDEIKIDENK